jgi:hypothetical protein
MVNPIAFYSSGLGGEQQASRFPGKGLAIAAPDSVARENYFLAAPICPDPRRAVLEMACCQRVINMLETRSCSNFAGFSGK